MPRQYEALRDKFKRQGLSSKKAKAKAARIYNAKHPDRPVTRKKHNVLGMSPHDIYTGNPEASGTAAGLLAAANKVQNLDPKKVC